MGVKTQIEEPDLCHLKKRIKKLTSCKTEKSGLISLLVSNLSALLLASLEIVNPGPHV